MFHMMNEARIGVGAGRHRAGLHRLPQVAGVRAGAAAGPAGRRRRTRPRRRCRSSSTPTYAGCCWRRSRYVEGALALDPLLRAAARRADDRAAPRPTRERAHLLLDVLTPIAKSWPSQWCLAANDLAIQVLGGYGYTRDYDVEQHWRDNRLNPIHEGTHGIQALDLLGRKVLMRRRRRRSACWPRRSATPSAGPARPAESAAELADGSAAAVDRLAEVTPALWADRRPGAGAGQRHRLPGGRRPRGDRVDVAGAVLVLPGRAPDGAFYAGKRQAARYFFRVELPQMARSSTCWRAGTGPRSTCARTGSDLTGPPVTVGGTGGPRPAAP